VVIAPDAEAVVAGEAVIAPDAEAVVAGEAVIAPDAEAVVAGEEVIAPDDKLLAIVPLPKEVEIADDVLEKEIMLQPDGKKVTADLQDKKDVELDFPADSKAAVKADELSSSILGDLGVSAVDKAASIAKGAAAIAVAKEVVEDIVQEEEEVVKKLTKEEIQFAKHKEIAAKIPTPEKKFKLSYMTQNNPAIINRPYYNLNNRHLNKATFIEEYYQMIFYAIDAGDIAMLESLTKRVGFNTEFETKGMPPFIYAVAGGRVDVVWKMVTLGYDINVVDDKGNTALHVAILNNREDLVSVLLLAGVDVYIPNGSYQRPIILAQKMNNPKIITMLKKAGASSLASFEIMKEYIEQR
jgi:hypothetical protein